MSNLNAAENVKFYDNLCRMHESEIKMYRDALSMTEHQLEQHLYTNNETEEVHYLQDQHDALANCILAAEESYFEACAELWIAQSLLNFS